MAEKVSVSILKLGLEPLLYKRKISLTQIVTFIIMSYFQYSFFTINISIEGGDKLHDCLLTLNVMWVLHACELIICVEILVTCTRH